MTRDEALARADLLAPINHPSGKPITFAHGVNGHQCPAQLVHEQLQSSEALGVLAAEVRRLEARCTALEAAPLVAVNFQAGGEVDLARRAKILEAARAIQTTLTLVDGSDEARRATLGRVEALVPELIKQARALRYGKSRRIANAQAIAIEGVVQQLKLVLGGEA